MFYRICSTIFLLHGIINSIAYIFFDFHATLDSLFSLVLFLGLALINKPHKNNE